MRQFIGAAGLLMMTACGQPGVNGNVQAAAEPAPTSVASDKWNAEDACSLLDKATVGAALGTEIVKVVPGPVTKGTDQTAGFSTCYYDLANGQRLAFMARQSPGPDNTPEAMQRTRSELNEIVGMVEDVSGVGKSAFWVPKLRQLVVFLGEDRYFSLTMPRSVGDKDPKTLALGLATRIK